MHRRRRGCEPRTRLNELLKYRKREEIDSQHLGRVQSDVATAPEKIQQMHEGAANEGLDVEQNGGQRRQIGYLDCQEGGVPCTYRRLPVEGQRHTSTVGTVRWAVRCRTPVGSGGRSTSSRRGSRNCWLREGNGGWADDGQESTQGHYLGEMVAEAASWCWGMRVAKMLLGTPDIRGDVDWWARDDRRGSWRQAGRGERRLLRVRPSLLRGHQVASAVACLRFLGGRNGRGTQRKVGRPGWSVGTGKSVAE